MMHHALKSRFRGAIAGALIFLPAPEIFPAIAESVIRDGEGNEIEDGSESPVSHREVLRAIATGLFWHQDLEALRQYCTTPETLILALAIALSCRDALNPRSLTSQICSYLQKGMGANDLDIEQLQLAQALVDRGESGAIARSRLGETIAFALYCFLSTPDEWELATQRAGSMQPIVGAIAAADRGYVPAGDARTLEIAIKSGDRLLAAWSGVYNLNRVSPNFNPPITAPDVLRRRL